MATKRKSKSAGQGKRRTTRKASLEALIDCPTSVFDGAVELDDARSESYLQTSNTTYLLMLDPDCSGVYDTGRVAQAYGVFKKNPGRNGRLTVDGFAPSTGPAGVLHVVRLAT